MRENLKVAMLREKITNNMLSELLNVRRETIANKLNGDTAFSIDEASAIWRTFFRQYDFHWLFEPEPKKPNQVA